MAHQTMKDTAINIKTEKVPEDYVATLAFLVKGYHPLNIHVTEQQLDQLVEKIRQFKQNR